MRNTPVTVETDLGSATFERKDRTNAVLRLDYKVPELQGEGVEAVCQAEIESMRASLTGLGSALAAQLGTVGTRPDLKRTWSDKDERQWNHDGGLTVKASAYSSQETLTHDANVSDALLVEEAVRQMIEQRTQSIRTVFRKIEDDLARKQSS